MMIVILVRSVIIGVFRRITIFIIIFYKLIDFIEVFRIKLITLNAEVSFDRFGKSCTLPALVLAETQCQIIGLTLWLEEVFNFMPRLSITRNLLFGRSLTLEVSKLISLQNCSQLAHYPILKLFLISFCN